MRIVLVLLLSMLGACNPFGANETPWVGYATQKDTGRLAWWVLSKSSYGECLDTMRWETSGNRASAASFRAPLGCGYSGNQYWRVWLVNVLAANMDHFECIARAVDPASAAAGRRYSPVLKGFPRETDSYRCE